MIQELNDDLKPIAEKVMAGDILNIRLLNKVELEKIIFYCIATLAQRLKYFEKYLEELTEEVTEPPLKKEPSDGTRKGNNKRGHVIQGKEHR